MTYLSNRSLTSCKTAIIVSCLANIVAISTPGISGLTEGQSVVLMRSVPGTTTRTLGPVFRRATCPVDVNEAVEGKVTGSESASDNNVR